MFGQVLDFRLPRFRRVAWTSRAACTIWEPRVEAACNAGMGCWIDAAERGIAALALVRAAPFEVPMLQRRFQAAGLRLSVQGPVAPERMVDILATPRTTGLWCFGGTSSAVKAGESAWGRGDVAGLGEILGVPDCCLEALMSDSALRRPEWTALNSPGLTSWQTNYTLHRLGLSPAPWLPCRADCARTLKWIDGQVAHAGLTEILSWPLEWSALHGIAQVLTPVFRLVHDTVATARKVQLVRGAIEASPTEGATGLKFPFNPPPHRPLEVRRTFRQGIVNIVKAAPAVEVGRVRSLLPGQATPRTLSEPLLLSKAAAQWPALNLSNASTATLSVGESIVLGGSSLEGPPSFLSPDLIGDLRFESLGVVVPELVMEVGPLAGSGLHRAPMPHDAWCPLIRGRRRWVFCAPGSEIELVGGEPDLLDPDVRNRLSRRGLDIHECEQLAGDVVCVPAGWWWQVRNLEATLSIYATAQSSLQSGKNTAV